MLLCVRDSVERTAGKSYSQHLPTVGFRLFLKLFTVPSLSAALPCVDVWVGVCGWVCVCACVCVGGCGCVCGCVGGCWWVGLVSGSVGGWVGLESFYS